MTAERVGSAALRHGAAGPVSHPADMPRLALVGSPNSGKTTLFNALTGLRAKTGNYPLPGVAFDHRPRGRVSGRPHRLARTAVPASSLILSKANTRAEPSKPTRNAPFDEFRARVRAEQAG